MKKHEFTIESAIPKRDATMHFLGFTCIYKCSSCNCELNIFRDREEHGKTVYPRSSEFIFNRVNPDCNVEVISHVLEQ